MPPAPHNVSNIFVNFVTNRMWVLKIMIQTHHNNLIYIFNQYFRH